MIGTLRQRLLARSPGFVKRAWARVEASPIGYRLARGAFWSLLGTAASRVLALGASVLAARLLGKAGFGELGIIQSTIGMFGTLAGFGLGLTATKHVAEFRTTNPERAGRILRMSALMCWFTGGLAAMALAISAPWLASSSLAAPHLTDELRLSALYLLFATVNGGQMGALSGFEAFKRIASVNWLFGALTLLCLPLGCWLGGLMGGVWGLIAAQGITCWISWRAIVREAAACKVPMRLAGWTTEFPLLWRFSLPVLLTNIAGQPMEWYAQSLLARQPRGYEQAAEFYACLQLRNIPFAVIGIFTAAVLPVYAQAKGDPRAQRSVLRFAYLIVAIAALPLLAGMMLAAKPVLLAYGRDFATGINTLRILLLSLVFVLFTNTARQVLIGHGQTWSTFVIYLAGGVVLVILALLAVPQHLAVGLAWATLAMDLTRALGCVFCLRALQVGSNKQDCTPKNHK